MANYENIKDYGFDKRTASEAREFGRKGGKAFGKARRHEEFFDHYIHFFQKGRRGELILYFFSAFGYFFKFFMFFFTPCNVVIFCNYIRSVALIYYLWIFALYSIPIKI